MSIEQKLDDLTAAITKLTAAVSGAGASGAVNTVTVSASEGDEKKAAAALSATEGDEKKVEPGLVWYHKPETREVWQEEDAGRRKGIFKVAEATAQDLISKYQAEAEQAEQAAAAGQPGDDVESTESGDDNFGDMDLEGEEDTGQKYDESQPMEKEAFAGAWREWTKAAVQKAMDDGAADQEAAQKEVKKFVVPLVKKFGEGDTPKIASIPDEKRAAFLNAAQGFFA